MAEQMNRTFFEEQLIEEMKKHPNLYTKRSQLGFHDYSTIEQSWDLVSKTLKSDTKTCKKIWRNLRDSYVRQLKKINSCIDNGTDSSQYTKWKHFNKMSFLKNVITHRPMSSMDSKSLDQSTYNGYSMVDSNHINTNSIINTKDVDYDGNSVSSEAVSDRNASVNGSDHMIYCLKPEPIDNDISNNNNNNNNNNFNNNECTEINSFLSKSSNTITNFSNNLRSLINEESFGQHVARSLENLTSLRRSSAKLKIQEILSEFEQEDAKDPIHMMPNIFLNTTFPKI